METLVRPRRAWCTTYTQQHVATDTTTITFTQVPCDNNNDRDDDDGDDEDGHDGDDDDDVARQMLHIDKRRRRIKTQH